MVASKIHKVIILILLGLDVAFGVGAIAYLLMIHRHHAHLDALLLLYCGIITIGTVEFGEVWRKDSKF